MQVVTTGVRELPKSGALEPYRRVKISSGLLALAGALERAYGTTNERSLATGLGVEDIAAVVLGNAQGTRKAIANGAISAFVPIYAAASGKVSATANGNQVGYSLSAATADGDEIEALFIPGLAGPLFASQEAASAAVTNTTAETAFNQSATLPANSVKVGDVLHIRIQGIAPATNSTDTLTIRLKIGATVIQATTAIDVANDDPFVIDAYVTFRAVGAAGSINGNSIWGLATTTRPGLLANTAIDTTVDQAITVTAQWSVANAGNSCRLDCLTCELLRK